MCDYCSADAPAEEQFDPDVLWGLARGFETELAGEPASEREWQIFMGRATGSLGFAALQRLSSSRRRAVEAIRSRLRSRFFCEQVG